jgi:copper chaperone CopZ
MLTASNKAHVACSRNFVKTFLVSLTCLCILGVGISRSIYMSDQLFNLYEFLKIQLMMKATSLKWWSVVSLMSSACCALQLVLNLFSVGCAGFNTILGPIRPIFLALALCGQVFMWYQIKLTSQYPQAIQASLLTFIISFMPEGLYTYHWVKGQRFKTATTTTTAAAAAAATTTTTTINTNSKQIVVQIENMGCLACVNTISNVMMGCAGVTNVVVRLDDGEADVLIQTDVCNVKEMCQKVTDVGFPASCSISKPPTTANSVTTAASNVNIYLQSIAAGLLSSSCCALQLGLNILSSMNIIHIGCAGFNTYLGPMRSITRTVTFVWLVYLWYKHYHFNSNKSKKLNKKKQRQQYQLYFSTLLTLFLMLLPEMLKYFNGPAIAPPTSNQIVLQYHIPNMGCEACEMNVRKIINRQSGVIDSSVHYDTKNGVANIYIAKDWHFNSKQLSTELNHAGYGLVSLDSVNGDDGDKDDKLPMKVDGDEFCEECEAEELDW